jgi:hypothetical protein
MESTIDRLRLLQTFTGSQEDLANRFVRDIQDQLDLIAEESEELLELLLAMRKDPISSRFLSFLLGVDFDLWLEETILSLMDEEEESEDE